MIKKLILIIGANGIGKSTVSEELLHHIPNTAYVDSDSLRMINPAFFNEETIELNRKNILNLMQNYFNTSFINNIIFPYGFHGHRKKLFDDLIIELQKNIEFDLCPILLVCDESENIRRMKNDNRDEERIHRAIKNTRSIYDNLIYPKIDVTNLTIEQTTNLIIENLEVHYDIKRSFNREKP